MTMGDSMEENCIICNDKGHTANEHTLFNKYFSKTIPELVSIIISNEVYISQLEREIDDIRR